MDGQFVTVRAGRFAFVRPEGEADNIMASAAALAALRRIPRRGDPVSFQIAETRDGRRRAIDLVLKGQ